MALVRYSMMVNVLDRLGQRAEHLKQCARVAGLVPVWRLRRPRQLGVLKSVVRRVLAEHGIGPREFPVNLAAVK